MYGGGDIPIIDVGPFLDRNPKIPLMDGSLAAVVRRHATASCMASTRTRNVDIFVGAVCILGPSVRGR
jgi:hypothetical protein